VRQEKEAEANEPNNDHNNKQRKANKRAQKQQPLRFLCGSAFCERRASRNFSTIELETSIAVSTARHVRNPTRMPPECDLLSIHG